MNKIVGSVIEHSFNSELVNSGQSPIMAFLQGTSQVTVAHWALPVPINRVFELAPAMRGSGTRRSWVRAWLAKAFSVVEETTVLKKLLKASSLGCDRLLIRFHASCTASAG